MIRHARLVIEAVHGPSGLQEARASLFAAFAAHSTMADVPIMIATSADLGPDQRARLAHATTILSKGDLNRQAMAVFLDTVGIGRKRERT